MAHAGIRCRPACAVPATASCAPQPPLAASPQAHPHTLVHSAAPLDVFSPCCARYSAETNDDYNPDEETAADAIPKSDAEIAMIKAGLMKNEIFIGVSEEQVTAPPSSQLLQNSTPHAAPPSAPYPTAALVSHPAAPLAPTLTPSIPTLAFHLLFAARFPNQGLHRARRREGRGCHLPRRGRRPLLSRCLRNI